MFSFHKNHSQLECLINNYLIVQNELGVNLVYQEIINYVNSGGATKINAGFISNLKEPFKSLLQLNLKNVTTVAIDFPIYFTSKIETKKTIMVCAMDSLPPIPTSSFWNDKNFDFTKNIGFWAPFSLIDNWQAPVGSMKTNIPFFRVLLDEYNLYITDVYKVFFRIEKNGQLINSNTIAEYTELKNQEGTNIHGYILSNEIEIIKPDAIVTLGNSARNKLLHINYLINFDLQNATGWSNEPQMYKWQNSIPIIAIPHISGAANGAKSAILNNSNYSSITGNYQNERLAKIIKLKINE